MSTTIKPKTIQGWHIGIGASGLMFVASAAAGDLGQLCQNPLFVQSLTAGNFVAVGLTVLEFLFAKAKGQ